MRRWSMLAIGLTATLCVNVFVKGVPLLIPALYTEHGLDLGRAGLLSAMPTLGMVATLFGWGYAVDRFGERIVLVVGSALTAAAVFAAAAVDSLVAVGAFLLLGGMAAASSNAASGRLVVGWFTPDERGLAMGIRQTAQPLAVALGAMVIPRLAQNYGVPVALLFPAALCVFAAVVSAFAVDPPRPERGEAPAEHVASPYRGSTVLLRIHIVSALMMVPQTVVWTFALVWLMVRHEWSATSAGAMLMVASVVGAGGRIATGWWSDRAGARMRPTRIIALTSAVTMSVLALVDWLDFSEISIAEMLAVAAMITVSDNSLSFTAIAERAGPFWSGRALGVQNTTQLMVASIAQPVFGGLIGVVGYPTVFALCAVFPFAAIPLVPVEPKGQKEIHLESQ